MNYKNFKLLQTHKLYIHKKNDKILINGVNKKKIFAYIYKYAQM